MVPLRLVLATRNPGKVREMQRLLASQPVRLLSLDDVGFHDEIDEPADTYVDNAGAKAATVMTATGLWTLADDSGIEIDALHGWPGAKSARWLPPPATDADRMHGLVREVQRRTPDDRRARYVCVVVLARPQSTPIVARGECLGTIIDEPRGHNGFGYDPVFHSNDLGMTFGEADDALKDGVSHRARAVRRLAESDVFAMQRSQL
jgi:XTP/dITP diphosphohydrolase